jgi:hypothetical protein
MPMTQFVNWTKLLTVERFFTKPYCASDMTGKITGVLLSHTIFFEYFWNGQQHHAYRSSSITKQQKSPSKCQAKRFKIAAAGVISPEPRPLLTFKPKREIFRECNRFPKT